jgi:hypothetical protein
MAAAEIEDLDVVMNRKIALIAGNRSPRQIGADPCVGVPPNMVRIIVCLVGGNDGGQLVSVNDQLGLAEELDTAGMIGMHVLFKSMRQSAFFAAEMREGALKLCRPAFGRPHRIGVASGVNGRDGY